MKSLFVDPRNQKLLNIVGAAALVGIYIFYFHDSQPKPKPINFVKRFAGAGDGRTDNYIPFKQAIEYLQTHPGTELFIPSGVYLVGQTTPSDLPFIPAQHLLIREAKNFVIRGESGTVIKSNVINIGLFLAHKCSNFTLKNLTLMGFESDTTSANPTGITLQSCVDFVVENVHLYDFRGAGITGDWLFRGEIKNCTWTHHRVDNSFGIEFAHVQDIKMDRLTLNSSPAIGTGIRIASDSGYSDRNDTNETLRLWPMSSNIQLTNCKLHNFVTTVIMQNAFNVLVDNCDLIGWGSDPEEPTKNNLGMFIQGFELNQVKDGAALNEEEKQAIRDKVNSESDSIVIQNSRIFNFEKGGGATSGVRVAAANEIEITVKNCKFYNNKDNVSFAGGGDTDLIKEIDNVVKDDV